MCSRAVRKKEEKNIYITRRIRVSAVIFLIGRFANAHKSSSKERKGIDRKGKENELKVSIFPLSN